jgi:hypothetical protein
MSLASISSDNGAYFIGITETRTCTVDNLYKSGSLMIILAKNKD